MESSNIQSIDNIPNRICTLHPSMKIEFLNLNTSTETVLKCSRCLNESTLEQKELMFLSLIESADKNLIFKEFPFIDSFTSQELKKLSKQNKDIVRDQVSLLFKDFRAELIDKLDRIQEHIFEKINQINTFQDEVINEYNKISEKDQLKKIIIDKDISFEEQNTQLKEIINRLEENQDENQILFEEKVEIFAQMNETVEFSRIYLSEMKENCIEQLDSLDKFIQREDSKIGINEAPNLQKVSEQLDKLFILKSEGEKTSLEEKIHKLKYAFSFSEGII